MTFKSKAGRMFWYKRDQCEKNGIPFDLDKEWIFERLVVGCLLTNLPFLINEDLPSSMSPSIDRIDPTKGYLKENCRIIINGLNMMKSSDSTDHNLYKIAEALLSCRAGTNKVSVPVLEAEFRYKLEEHFTERQADIILKRSAQLVLTKTEQEYYSRVIRKKVIKLSSILPWIKKLYLYENQ